MKFYAHLYNVNRLLYINVDKNKFMYMHVSNEVWRSVLEMTVYGLNKRRPDNGTRSPTHVSIITHFDIWVTTL